MFKYAMNFFPTQLATKMTVSWSSTMTKCCLTVILYICIRHWHTAMLLERVSSTRLNRMLQTWLIATIRGFISLLKVIDQHYSFDIHIYHIVMLQRWRKWYSRRATTYRPGSTTSSSLGWGKWRSRRGRLGNCSSPNVPPKLLSRRARGNARTRRSVANLLHPTLHHLRTMSTETRTTTLVLSSLLLKESLVWKFHRVKTRRVTEDKRSSWKISRLSSSSMYSISTADSSCFVHLFNIAC